MFLIKRWIWLYLTIVLVATHTNSTLTRMIRFLSNPDFSSLILSKKVLIFRRITRTMISLTITTLKKLNKHHQSSLPKISNYLRWMLSRIHLWMRCWLKCLPKSNMVHQKKKVYFINLFVSSILLQTLMVFIAELPYVPDVEVEMPHFTGLIEPLAFDSKAFEDDDDTLSFDPNDEDDINSFFNGERMPGNASSRVSYRRMMNVNSITCRIRHVCCCDRRGA